MRKHVIQHKYPRVNSTLEADVWFEPGAVIEILGAEITLGPIHTCAMDSVRKRSGLAIRFPGFTMIKCKRDYKSEMSARACC